MPETPSVKKKGLQPKDLINIGIFTALYFIIIMAVAMLGYNSRSPWESRRLDQE